MYPPESNKWAEELPTVSPPKVLRVFQPEKTSPGSIASIYGPFCQFCHFGLKSHDPITKQCPCAT